MTARMRRIRQPPITPPMMEVSFGLGVVPSASASSADVLVSAGEVSVVVVVGDEIVDEEGVGVEELVVVEEVVVPESWGLLD